MRKDVEAEYDGHCGTKIYIQWFVMTYSRNDLNLYQVISSLNIIIRVTADV